MSSVCPGAKEDNIRKEQEMYNNITTKGKIWAML
jgi:hypothetical protein